MAPQKTAPLILVVDDYEDAREMYAEYLEFSGFRAATARNGDEAIALARKLKPALILMDLSMPGMDGWEATRILKSDERTRGIPVIALTGHALAGNEEEARRSGCDGFIAKPCLPPELVAKVRSSLARPARFPTMDARQGVFEDEVSPNVKKPVPAEKAAPSPRSAGKKPAATASKAKPRAKKAAAGKRITR